MSGQEKPGRTGPEAAQERPLTADPRAEPLRAALEELSPRLDEETAVRLAATGVKGARSPRGADAGRRELAGGTSDPLWGIPRRAALVAAAVAVLVALGLGWLARGAAEPDAELLAGAIPAPEPPRSFAVDAAPGQRVAVFRTADPRIHVVWLY